MGYVGQTVNTLGGRWKGCVRSAFNPKSRICHWEFPKAIREHGVDRLRSRIKDPEVRKKLSEAGKRRAAAKRVKSDDS